MLALGAGSKSDLLGFRIEIVDEACLAIVPSASSITPSVSLISPSIASHFSPGCATHGYQPLTVPKFAAELKALGYGKWKSCGLIRYRGLQLVA
jgi:hypothetical protein